MKGSHDLQSSSKKKKSGSLGGRILLFLFLILVGAVVFAGIILFETEKPLVNVPGSTTALGQETEISFTVSDGRSGVQSIVVEVRQGGTSKEIFRKRFPRRSWIESGGPERVDELAVFSAAGTKFKDGEAELVITARDFSLNGFLKGNKTEFIRPVVIDTSPPRVALKHTQRYIRPGGSGLIVYDLSEPVVSHGVVVNDNFFPGYPMEDREGRYLAYIALPWDAEKIELSTVVARDKAGNEGKSVFSMIYKPKQYKSDRINVSDSFLSSKIPEFEGNAGVEIKGANLLEKFLFVNNEIRRANAETILKLCARSGDRRLWQDRFLRMAGQTMAGYAEKRTYYYNDKAVDQQVHLGMDIASTTSVPIKAANRGKVVFANYLGIYGNTVILDHGQGLFSLYSHLSRIDTVPDEIVDQGAIIAHSGATGMAGGDHLHFSILISGIFANPIEWMDQNWIEVNIKDILSRL
ncbi:MAG: M23 family metallopeptidase [Desulfobulbaceae bacterium]